MLDYEDEQLKKNENPKFLPHFCPVCGSLELAYVPEYHKCIGKRITIGIFKIVAWICFAIMLFRTLNGLTIGEELRIDNSLEFPFFASLVMILFGKVSVFGEESSTHIQGICKSCGHIWFIT